MDLPLYGTVLVSAASAALVVVIATRAIEKLGGVTGGVIATTPNTIVIAALGLLSVSTDREHFVVALYNVPIGELIDAAFLCTWRFLPPRLSKERSLRVRLALMTLASLSVWLVLAVVQFMVNQYVIGQDVKRARIMGLGGITLAWLLGTSLCWNHVDAPCGTRHVSSRTMCIRALATATSISVCVSVGSISAVAGGILSTFPAIFLTTMLSVWISQGQSVGAGAVGPMVLGATSPPCFAMLFAEGTAFLRTDTALASAWLIAICGISIPAAFYIRWRQRVAEDRRYRIPVATNDAEDDDSDSEAQSNPLLVATV